MIEKLVTVLITFYQYTLSPIFTSVFGTRCRYKVSCSEYAKQSITTFGIAKGSALAIRRLLSCQPFGTIAK